MMTDVSLSPTTPSLKAVGLFAGIGGMEEGLRRAGIATELVCEIDAGARRVLADRLKGSELKGDIRELKALPAVDIVAAGFPCQNLSQAGQADGIHGKSSKLVREVFRLLSQRKRSPTWVVLENVPFMLRLQRGRAITYIIRKLEELGFAWAYRVIDTRAFGLPQRRERVIILASRTEDPRPVLLGIDTPPNELSFPDAAAYGFYWTEGNRGLGWAVNALPALKGGSSLAIPSPPAIWLPETREIVTPDVRDAERLQGFLPNWTRCADDADRELRRSHRWKLIGNAVSVPVMKWLGQRLTSPSQVLTSNSWEEFPKVPGETWPTAAWGVRGRAFTVRVSPYPVRYKFKGLNTFLKYPVRPLSLRAASGFLARAQASCLKFQHGFIEDIAYHVERMRNAEAQN